MTLTSQRDKPWTLIAVCLGTFMLLVDISIVYVALPDIGRSLGASFSDLQWTVDAYAVALAALLLNAGSLGDLYGHRRVYAAGLSVFTLASLLCGLANDATFLDLSRALEGIGGAAMFATSLALLGNAYHGKARGVAFAAWGATAGVAVAVGPLVGGALTTYASWSWIFYVNVPVGLVTIALVAARVDETTRRRESRPDWLGFLTLTGALVTLVYGLIRGNTDGWTSGSIVGAFVAGAVLLAAFLAIEALRKQPMLELSLFRNRALVGASFAALALSASLFSMLLYLTVYLQQILHYSAMETGVRFLTITGLVLVGAPISGRLSEKVPLRVLLGVGFAFVTCGLALMTRVDVNDDWTALVAGFLVSGLGAGICNPAIAAAAIRTVSPDRIGVGSGVSNTSRQIGIAGGIAGLGAIFQHRVHDSFISRLHETAPNLDARSHQLADQIGSSGIGGAMHQAPPQAAAAIELALRGAFVDGLGVILWVAAAVAAIGFLASVALVRSSDFVAAAPEDGEGRNARTSPRASTPPRQSGGLAAPRREA
jgi:EmrB/QacA subfamily drug resistance transporter